MNETEQEHRIGELTCALVAAQGRITLMEQTSARFRADLIAAEYFIKVVQDKLADHRARLPCTYEEILARLNTTLDRTIDAMWMLT